MNLTEEKKAPLRQRNLEQKRIMLAMQFKGTMVVSSRSLLFVNSLYDISLLLSFHYSAWYDLMPSLNGVRRGLKSFPYQDHNKRYLQNPKI